MGKRRTATPVPDIAGLPGDTLICAAQAAALIASRDLRPDDNERIARDRARKRLKDSVKVGKLPETAPGQFRLADLGQFLRARWPGKFDDIPIVIARVGSASGKASAVGHSLTLPGDLESCHRMIEEYSARTTQLAQELEAALAKIRELEPGAIKRRELRAKRSTAGKQGGRGKQK